MLSLRTFSAFSLAVVLALPLTAAEPFNGKDTTGWKFKGDAAKSKWAAGFATMDGSNLKIATTGEGAAQLINPSGGGVDIYSDGKWGDQKITLELMVPKGSNSGVYVQGEYEVQVLDSYGKKEVGMGDLGALYSAAAPKVNVAKKPGEWQTLEIEFIAPKFDGEKKTANAVFKKVTLNGTVIHENVEMKAQTPGGITGKEHAEGPLMFQGDHGAVAFRNIKVEPLK